MPASSSSGAPLEDSSTVSSTSGMVAGLQRIGHGRGDVAIAQHADLDGVGADIAQRRRDLRRARCPAAPDVTRSTRLVVSCTVTAVIAVWA